ncbi:MAG: hypothetical protein WBP79_07905 [Candidatus Acidiferrales bacterium]
MFVVAFGLLVFGCHRSPPLDTSPLDLSGMSFDTVQQLKTLNISAAEVAELAKLKQAGFSDSSCLAAVQIFRQRGAAFNAGDTIAGLVRAGIKESTVLELARMNQLGLVAGELQAMRLAGLSDEIVLAVAHRRAEGKPVLSGASLAGMKNAGIRNTTLLELARRGVPDSQANAIISSRRHGASDADILRRFTGS